MQDSGRDIPARSDFQSICAGKIEDVVVASARPCLQAADDLLSGRVGIQSEVGVWEIVPDKR